MDLTISRLRWHPRHEHILTCLLAHSPCLKGLAWHSPATFVAMPMYQSDIRSNKRRQLFAELSRSSRDTDSSIARRVGVCRATVARWRCRVDSGDDSLLDKPRCGGPSKLVKAEVAKARRHLEQAGHGTIATATQLLNASRTSDSQVSSRTVRRQVKSASAGLQYGTPFRQKVSADNALRRKQKTSKAAIRAVKKKINRLIFLDAAYVSWRRGHPIKAFRRGLAWSSRRRPRPQQLGGHRLYQFYAAITKGPDGAMHQHPLIFVPANKGLNAQLFVQQVASPMLTWARQVFRGVPGFEFVQDNASCHTAELTEEWMEVNDYVLHDHPPQSPDLNRIEKAWAYFKSEVVGRRPRTETGFYKIMQTVWMGLDTSTLSSFIDQLPCVMAVVHEDPQRQVQW